MPSLICGTWGLARRRRCTPRVQAERAGALVWAPALGAYALRGAPRRAVSQHAAALAARHGAHPRPGEPYRWSCCPWCGGDLLPP